MVLVCNGALTTPMGDCSVRPWKVLQSDPSPNTFTQASVDVIITLISVVAKHSLLGLVPNFYQTAYVTPLLQNKVLLSYQKK